MCGILGQIAFTDSPSAAEGTALLAPLALQAQTAATPAEASRHFERGYLLAQQGSLEEAFLTLMEE